ncbi:lysozyme, partial [Streptomyces sp. SID10362]|nr:lysozyme [Streptomyces sp. SID10362]
MPAHRSGTPRTSRRPRLAAAGTLLTSLALLLALPGAATAAPAGKDVPARGTARMGQGVIEH